MTSPDGSTPSARAMRYAITSIRILAALLVVLAVAGGVVEANEGDDPGNPGRSCPGENPNQGLENANPTGADNSRKGIATAAAAIGCPPPEQ